MGLCVYCQTTWLVIFTYPFLFELSLWYLLSVGGCYIFLKIFEILTN